MYSVLLQSASGRTLTLPADGRTGEAATRAALAIAERERPGEGWLAIRAVSHAILNRESFLYGTQYAN